MRGWAAGLPVCSFVDAGASIHARHLVDSLVAPQTMATSSRARVLHATSAQHGYVNGGYSLPGVDIPVFFPPWRLYLTPGLSHKCAVYIYTVYMYTVL